MFQHTTRTEAGSPQVVQLTALRPTADLFCSLLRDALKAELNRGQMKAVKTFIQTCYSEVLVANAEEGEENAIEKQLAALIDGPSLYCAVTPIVGRREAGFERSFRRRGNIEAEP